VINSIIKVHNFYPYF